MKDSTSILFDANFVKKSPQKWGTARKPRHEIFLKKTPVMPAREQGHRERKGISYSSKTGIKASGVRLTSANNLA